MKTELMMITPKVAREMLECNTANRPLRPGVVATLATAFKRGEWRITHQGIAFATDGRLLDGQHRLTFISDLPDKSEVPMLVTTGLSDDAFQAIDQGKARTVRDLYGSSEGMASVARVFAGIVNSAKVKFTPPYIKSYMDWVEPEYELLTSFTPQTKKFWSCAEIRSAAIYQMKRGHDKDRIRVIYDALVKSNISAMPHAARVFAQQYLSGVTGNPRGYDAFCRALKVFNTKEPFTGSKLLIRDIPGAMSEVRDFTLSEMKKKPSNTGLKVAKPDAQFNWKQAA